MAAGKNRFDFLDEVAAETAPPKTAPARGKSKSAVSAQAPAVAQVPEDRPYLYQTHPRSEPQAPLGNRVKLQTKHILEDYVRDLKRAGHPATEARVLEALMLLVDSDTDVRAKLSIYLTGKTD